MKKLFVGIDFGTSGIRIIIIDAYKSVIYEDSENYLEAVLGSNKQTVELWVSGLHELFSQVPNGLKQRIQSICFNGTSSTVFLVDEQLKPTSDVLMYNDASAVNVSEDIISLLPPESGAQGVTSSLAKVLYLLEQNQAKDHFSVCHQADYFLNLFLEKNKDNSSKSLISDENNCLKLGYDVLNQEWPAFLKQFSNLNGLLPTVVSAGVEVGKIDSIIAEQFGLPSMVQMVSGTTDSTAAFIATGASEIGDAVTSLGSTLVVKVLSHLPIFSKEEGIYSHRLKDQWIVGGASNSGGNVLRHYFSSEQLQAMSSELKPNDLLDLNYYPLLEKGERFPIADANLEPKLMPKPNDNIKFFQAIIEGISDIEKLAYDKLAEKGITQIKCLRSVGLGATNEAWTTIRQNKLGVTFTSSEHLQAAYGSAILAKNAVLE